MYVLITYDVSTSTDDGQKRLRQVSKCCTDYGQRVQNSVFECMVNESQLLILKSKLKSIMDKENDTIRIYNLGKNYKHKIEQLGKETSFDIGGDLII